MPRIEEVTTEFSLPASPVCSRRMVSGSEHESWLVDLSDGSSVVLQKLNSRVFLDLEAMCENALAVSEFLEGKGGELRVLHYLEAAEGGLTANIEDELWRGYRYIERSHTPPTETLSSHDAVESARALAKFHLALEDYPVETLSWPLPDHHNTAKRFEDFRKLLADAPKALADSARDEIAFILKQSKLASKLMAMEMPARAVHNELRTSNIILDNETGRAMGVLSYDSVQPGLLCFDFGELVNFACTLSKPDERVLKKVRFDLDRYADMAKAYIKIMKPAFDKSEPASLAPGCVVMALELGIRYLGDYLTGNGVFPAAYPEQNLYRARTQLMLCMQMQYYFKEMENIIKRCLK